MDGEHGLHRPERLVLAHRQARPARLRPLRPRPDARGRVRGGRRGGAARAATRSTPSACAAIRRRAAPTASTCSCRWPAATATTRPASSCSRSRGRWLDSRPDLVTTEWSKAKRRGVLIDANQNGPGRTIAFAYSVRPQPGAPVSTPVDLGRAARRASSRSASRCPRCSTASSRPRRPVRAGPRGPPGARPGAALALTGRGQSPEVGNAPRSGTGPTGDLPANSGNAACGLRPSPVRTYVRRGMERKWAAKRRCARLHPWW